MKRYNFSLDPNMRWSLFADGSTGFSIEDGEAISKVLQFVGLEFESILGKALVDSHATLAVAHTNDSPVTWRAYNLIFLSSSDNTYLQHIYQFFHELCHFMVSLDVCDSFRWFEETICQIMSWFILERIYEKRDISPCKPLAPYYDCFPRYIQEDMDKRYRLNGLPLSNFILKNLAYLKRECEDHFVNRTIGYEIYPLFKEHPNLWRIVQYLDQLNDGMGLDDAIRFLSDIAGVENIWRDQLVQRMTEQDLVIA